MKTLASFLIVGMTILNGWFVLTLPKQVDIWDDYKVFGATNFPTSLDTLTNPSGTDSVATVSHSGQHSNANDAIEAIEAKVGITASTPITGTVLAGTGAGTSVWTTFATTTNLQSTNILATGSSTLQNFTFINATGTKATTTDFFSTIFTATNATTTNLFSTTASSTNLFATLFSGGNITSSGLGTFTNLLANASSTFQNFTAVNATTTHASTTSLSTARVCFTGDSNNCLEAVPTAISEFTDYVKFVPFQGNNTFASTTIGSDEVWTYPVTFDHPISVDKVRWSCTNGSTDTSSVGLFSLDGNTKHIDSGVGTCPSSANQIVTRHVSPAVSVSSGMYILAWTSDAASAFQSWGDAAANNVVIRGLANASTTYIGKAANTSTSGALPSTLGTITSFPVEPIAATFEK